jgi:hypothetical protein
MDPRPMVVLLLLLLLLLAQPAGPVARCYPATPTRELPTTSEEACSWCSLLLPYLSSPRAHMAARLIQGCFKPWPSQVGWRWLASVLLVCLPSIQVGWFTQGSCSSGLCKLPDVVADSEARCSLAASGRALPAIFGRACFWCSLLLLCSS